MNQIIENISEALKHTNDLLKAATDNFDNLYKLHVKNLQRYANLLEENDDLLDFVWDIADLGHSEVNKKGEGYFLGKYLDRARMLKKKYMNSHLERS